MDERNIDTIASGNRWPIYFLLFSISPTLIRYAQNIKDVPIGYLVLPLVMSLAFACLIWATAFFVVRDSAKAALISTLSVFWFFFYGPLFANLEFLNWAFDIQLIRDVYLIPLVLVVWVAMTRAVFKTTRSIDLLTPYLNIFSIILVCLSVFNISLHVLKQFPDEQHFAEERSAEHGADVAAAELPDLYFLILDEYSGFEAIKTVYGFDNAGFSVWLQTRGFQVAHGSQCLYFLTEESTGSTLNMRPLEKGADAMGVLRSNMAVRLLKERGYTIVQLPMNENGVFEQADVVLGFPWKKHMTTTVSDFMLLFLEQSMLRPLYEYLIKSDDFGQYQRDKIRFALDQVDKVVLMKGPKFVYLHIQSPHFPFVFQEDGSAAEMENFYNLKDKQHYLGQYKYITKEIAKVVETIMDRSTRPVAIILQSDHGHRGFAPLNRGFKLDMGENWKNVLNAFYFPKNDLEVDDDISPIDTVRLFFETYGMTRIEKGNARSRQPDADPSQ